MILTLNVVKNNFFTHSSDEDMILFHLLTIIKGGSHSYPLLSNEVWVYSRDTLVGSGVTALAVKEPPITLL